MWRAAYRLHWGAATMGKMIGLGGGGGATSDAWMQTACEDDDVALARAIGKAVDPGRALRRACRCGSLAMVEWLIDSHNMTAADVVACRAVEAAQLAGQSATRSWLIRRFNGSTDA